MILGQLLLVTPAIFMCVLCFADRNYATSAGSCGKSSGGRNGWSGLQHLGPRSPESRMTMEYERGRAIPYPKNRARLGVRGGQKEHVLPLDEGTLVVGEPLRARCGRRDGGVEAVLKLAVALAVDVRRASPPSGSDLRGPTHRPGPRRR